MNFELNGFGKWFYCDMCNYESEGFSFMLTKCDEDKGRKAFTYSVRLVKLSENNALEDIIPPIEGIISACICCDTPNYVIYNYRKDGQQFFCSTLTEKKLIKRANTSFIPYGGLIIIAEHQGESFDCEDTVYECYDGQLNLLWRYLQRGYINDGAYKLYKDYIEIGADNKLFFNEKGVLTEAKGQKIPIRQSDWYANDEDRSFIEQVCERCVTRQSVAKSLFNGKEYVLHCDSPTKRYIAKFDLNFKPVWKLELQSRLGTYQLLYYDGVYYSIGCRTDDSFYICAVNEDGKILGQSENIEASEVYGHIANGKLVVFYNRTDNLSKAEKKILSGGVMIANGYCLLAD
ncbi:MAG: hypothetical protein LUD27_08025 [Clostridia bacterium]|nr:hypothetical protein [Clostridia bacterium]